MSYVVCLRACRFANALLVIPRTLIVNAAKDAAELVSQLISKHTVAQTVKGKEDLRFLGLDLVEGSVVDNVKRGVLEPALSKVVLGHISTVLASNFYPPHKHTHARARLPSIL